MKKEFKIGNLYLEGPFMLAPLAGISDAPFRRLCFYNGASYACSEMVSAKGLYYKDKNTNNLLEILEKEGPVGFQLFGSEPQILAWATKELEGRENKVVDINMGCPVPKIVKNGEGSSLLKDPGLIYELVSSMVSSTKKPVTAKIRIGFDKESLNYLEVAKAIERAGASAIAVHGRTREQYYSGEANWNAIREIKEALSIPVIGNGDVTDGISGLRMIEETGCDFVMVGRGAFGNPWIFSELNSAFKLYQDGLSLKEIESVLKPAKPEISGVKAMMLTHFNDLLALKGEYVAIREMRKHVGWYLKGFKGATKLRGMINQINDKDELVRVIKAL